MGVRSAADILLADGSTARVRQIAPSDADAILALHARLSERTRYLRYFSAYPPPPVATHRPSQTSSASARKAR